MLQYNVDNCYDGHDTLKRKFVNAVRTRLALQYNKEEKKAKPTS